MTTDINTQPADKAADSGKSPRRSRLVFTGSTRDECVWLKKEPDTAAAQALLADIEATLGDATWVYWSTRGLDTESGAKTLWVGLLFDVIDRHLTQALALCEKTVASHQISLLQVMGHPAGGLARSLLEQHRSWLAEWVHMRSIDMTEDEHAQWRRFLACGVDLHNQAADLLAQARQVPASVVPTGTPSMVQTASTTFANLLLAGQLDKTRAAQMVDLLADYVAFCNQMPGVPAALQPAWVRVRRTVDNEAVELPVSELRMLFPGRLLHQTLDTTLAQSGAKQVSLFNEVEAMVLADDYERLAWQLTYPPVVLACVASPDSSQAAGTLGEVYGVARATLLASANLLRALFRRQMLTYVANDDFEPDDADVRYMDLDPPVEPDLEVDMDELQNGMGAPLTLQQRDQKFVNHPDFCEVCFRATVSRKFCGLHQNTGGLNRADIRDAKQLLPAYRKTLLTLQVALRDPALAMHPFVTGVPIPSEVQATTLEGALDQTIGRLDGLLTCAVWGLGEESQAGQTVRRQLADAVAEITRALQLVSVTEAATWSAIVTTVADLQALHQECDALVQLIDVPPGQLDKALDHQQLLGYELRSFVAAYNADMLGRMAAMCRQPQQMAFVPEDARRHFYTQWLNGYKPHYSYGHGLVLDAHDEGFLLMSRGRSAFSPTSLWDHYARLAAWRVAQSLAQQQKQRLRRLTRSKVLALRDQGVSIEEIADKMRTTPDGVRAALARWDAKSSSSENSSRL